MPNGPTLADRTVKVLLWVLGGVTLGMIITPDDDTVKKFALLASVAIFATLALMLYPPLRVLYRWPFARLAECAIRWEVRDWFSMVRKEWIQFIKHDDKRVRDLWVIRKSLAETYLAEERRDISGEADRRERGRPQTGHECQPLIVTNFVNYSAQVTSLMRACEEILKRNKDKALFCFTSLSMPLTKWFNFHDSENAEHPRWTEYLTQTEASTRTFRDGGDGLEGERRFLCRCLVHGVGGRTQTNLEEEAKSKIWITKTEDSSNLFALSKEASRHETVLGQDYRVPSRDEVVAALTNGGEQAAADYINANYSSKGRSYVVIPDGILLNDYEDGTGSFDPLISVFIQKYHSVVNMANPVSLSIHCAPNRAFLAGTVTGTQRIRPPVPTDFFYVGLAPLEKIQAISNVSDLAAVPMESLFCLAGTEDDSLKTIHLYLLDPSRTRKRLEWIEEHMRDLLTRGSSCADLV